MSVLAGCASYYFMLQYMPLFIERKLYGRDQCKVKLEKINKFQIPLQSKKEREVPIPEPIGVVAAAIYLIFLFIFIPIPFYDLINKRTLFTGVEGLLDIEWFSFNQ